MKAPSVWTILGYVGLTGQILQSVPVLKSLFVDGRKPSGKELYDAVEPDVEQFRQAFAVKLDDELVSAYCNAVALTYDRKASGKEAGQVCYEGFFADNILQHTPWADLQPASQARWTAAARALVG